MTKKLKVGDIIEVDMSYEILDVPEDATTIDVSDYKQKYSVDYSSKDTGISLSYDMELEPGEFWTDDITEVIKTDLPQNFKEVKDYEIFDIENFNNESYSAKVRIKAVE